MMPTFGCITCNICFCNNNLLWSVEVTPPETNPRDNLVVIQLRGGSTVNLCANSEDESM